MKVNLDVLREAQEIRAEHLLFCQDCGETEPANGFYPMGIRGPDSLSTLLCNDCEQERRKGA